MAETKTTTPQTRNQTPLYIVCIALLVAGVNGEKITFLAVCGKEAVAKGVKAGDIIKQVTAMTAGLEGKDEEITKLNTLLENLEAVRADLENQLSSAVTLSTDTQAQLTEEQDRANALDASLTKTEEVLSDTQAQLTEEQDRANALDASLTKVEEVLADTQAQLTAAQTQASDLADQLSTLETQYGALEESSTTLTEKVEGLTSDKADLEKQVEELTASKADLEAKVAELGDALEESEAQTLQESGRLQLRFANAYDHAYCYARGLSGRPLMHKATEKGRRSAAAAPPFSVSGITSGFQSA